MFKQGDHQNLSKSVLKILCEASESPEGEELQDDRSLLLKSRVRLQRLFTLYNSFLLCCEIKILNPGFVFCELWPLTGVLAHFLRVMFDLGMLSSLLPVPCYSLKPGTPAHKTPAIFLCWAASTAVCSLGTWQASGWGSFLTLWESKTESTGSLPILKPGDKFEGHSFPYLTK